MINRLLRWLGPDGLMAILIAATAIGVAIVLYRW